LREFYVLGVEHSYDYSHNLFGIQSNLEAGGRIHFDRFIDDKKSGNAPDARDGIYFSEDEVTGEITIKGQSHHYETFATSLFLLEKIDINDNLTIVPGFRFEGFEQVRIDRLRGSTYQDKTTTVFLPGIGVNYEIHNYNLFGGIHRGFTPPSSGTLKVLNFGRDLSEGLELDAELSWNSEIGIRRNSRNLAFEITGFNMDIENLVAAGKGTKFKNLGRVNFKGVETALTLKLSGLHKQLRYLPDIHFFHTYLKTEIINGEINSALSTGTVDISGNKMPYAPKQTYTIGFSKKIIKKLTIRADLHYVDWVYTDFENIAYTENRGDQGIILSHKIINASLTYRFNEQFNVFVAGKNILDEIYVGSRLHSNPGQPQANLSSGIIPGARRQLNAGLKYTF